MRLRFTIFMISIAVLGLAGCGGSDGESSAPLTQAELVAKADAVCKQSKADIDAIQDPTDIAGLATAIDAQLKIIEDAMNELKELNPPENLASDYEAWLAALDAKLEVTKEARDAAETGVTAEVEKAIEKLDIDTSEEEKLAKKIGFKECST
jgi:hypothetical protein